MSQLTFKFPFKAKYYEQDFYVSNNNFSAYKLIESWPNWPNKWMNIYGVSGSGKTHLSKILEKKIEKVKILDAKEVENIHIDNLEKIECLIIDNYEENINNKLFYSLLNHSKQLENFIQTYHPECTKFSHCLFNSFNTSVYAIRSLFELFRSGRSTS